MIKVYFEDLYNNTNYREINEENFRCAVQF